MFLSFYDVKLNGSRKDKIVAKILWRPAVHVALIQDHVKIKCKDKVFWLRFGQKGSLKKKLLSGISTLGWALVLLRRAPWLESKLKEILRCKKEENEGNNPNQDIAILLTDRPLKLQRGEMGKEIKCTSMIQIKSRNERENGLRSSCGTYGTSP